MVRPITVKPVGSVDLDHRAYLLRGMQNALIAVQADPGRVSVLTSDFAIRRWFSRASKIRGLSLHPLGLLAIVDDGTGSIVLQKLDGTRITDIAAPPASTRTTDQQLQLGFEDCFFDLSESHLWVVARLSSYELEIQLIEANHWSVVAKTSIEDPFGDSACVFSATGHPGSICLWIAAGQDGQQVCWLKMANGQIKCETEPSLKNTTPPVFSPSGDRFLIVDEGNSVCQFRFPSVIQLGPPLESELDDDNRFDFPLCYLNDDYALVGTASGRQFAIALSNMAVTAEVVLEGHEPRPIKHYFPSRTDEKGICTDILFSQPIGENIVSVFRRNWGKSLDGWKDTLLWSPIERINDLFGP